MSDLVKYIKSGSRMPGIKNSLESIVIGLPGTPTELLIYQGKIYVYDSLGQTLIDGGYISARAFAAASVTTSKLVLAHKKFINNIDFTATDNNTCSWGAGNIVFADGTQVNTNAGNTGNMGTTTYIFYNGSSANLQNTTSMMSAIGGSNIPLAIVDPVDTNEGACVITPFLAAGTTIDGDKIITGKISSSTLKTFFDLNENKIQVGDVNTARVVVGKMANGSYGVKASLPGYTADVDTDVNHYAVWATSDDSVDNVLIKEKTRGSVSIGDHSTEQFAHELGYIPFALVFVEESPGRYIKAYGWDMSNYGVAYSIDDTYLSMANYTGGTKIFKYYIFYDRVSSGNYEEIYVHDITDITDEVST